VRLRTLVTGAFTRRRLTRFADVIRERAARLLKDAGSRFDLPRDVTDELPLANLCDLLGVPNADRGLLLEWTNRVIGYQDPEHGVVVTGPDGKPVNPRSPAQLADMFAYAADLAERKRHEPADDVMTALVQAEVDGERLTDAELKMFFFLLVIAGNDTVRSALPGGVLLLLRHPAEYARLAADPALLPSAIEEMLRLHPPVLTFRRTATRDPELGGQAIRAGDKVVVYHVSANVDERRFPDPFRFDVARSPNDHVAFGQGPAPLPRRGLRRAADAGVLRRAPGAGGAAPRRRAAAAHVELHQRADEPARHDLTLSTRRVAMPRWACHSATMPPRSRETSSSCGRRCTAAPKSASRCRTPRSGCSPSSTASASRSRPEPRPRRSSACCAAGDATTATPVRS
jgi:hypothetical protein